MGAGTDPSLRSRIISSALFVPTLLGVIWLGPLAMAAAFGLVVLAGGWELSRILPRIGFNSPAALSLAGPLVFAAALMPGGAWLLHLTWLPWVAALLWLFFPVSPRVASNGPAAWAAQLLVAAYWGLLAAHVVALRAGPWDTAPPAGVGPRWVYLALLLTWASDTGAFVAGTAFGRRPLWRDVSPKKTIEGAVGGFVLPAIVALLAGPLFMGRGGGGPSLLLGAMAGIAAPLGDLLESRLKRKADVKDSGRFLPGHGGVLDRFDSLFFAAPLFHYTLLALAR